MYRPAPVRLACKAIHAAAEKRFAACGAYFVQHPGNNPAQYIGTDVRLCLERDILRRSQRTEGLQYECAPGIIDPGQQLAVRKGSRAARAELNIGFGVQFAVLREARHRSRALRDGVAPVDEQRSVPLPGKQKGAEQPRRSHPHYRGRAAGHSPRPNSSRPGA